MLSVAGGGGGVCYWRARPFSGRSRVAWRCFELLAAICPVKGEWGRGDHWGESLHDSSECKGIGNSGDRSACGGTGATLDEYPTDPQHKPHCLVSAITRLG